MFSLGDAYELFMGRWSAHLAPLLVQFAGVADGDAVLDVGSGTGAVAAAVADAAPSSRILGVDRSTPYIQIANARRRSPQIQFQGGDAQRLPFKDAAFDRTLSMLILNFVPDPRKALTEMARVTRPGGVVAAAVWDYGEGMEMLRVFWDAVVALDPRAADKDERHMPLSRAGELEAMWRTSLVDVSETALTIETRFSSFEDYWSPFLLGQGPAGAYVGTLSLDRREQLELTLRQHFSGQTPMERPTFRPVRMKTPTPVERPAFRPVQIEAPTPVERPAFRPAGPADESISLRARAWAVRGTVPARGPRAGSTR